MNYLGIDGGGTKTDFMIINEKGNILAYYNGQSCHYKQFSMQEFENVLMQGINEVCKQANISIQQINFSFCGLPGFGENDANEMKKIIKKILKSNSYRCGNDVEAGWAGSLACNPGINIVSGTGAIGYGVDYEQNTARCSGWGHFCGDEGSAYWIGKKVLELFGKESDDRLEKTPIYEIVKQELDIEKDFDIISLVIDKFQMKRNKIAKLAILLYKAAKMDDKYAINIFKQAAFEHSLTVNSIIKKLNFKQEQDILISYSGGVFNSGSYIIEPFKSYILEKHDNVKIIKPILKPITGSSLLALKLHNQNYDKKIIDTLKEEELKLENN